MTAATAFFLFGKKQQQSFTSIQLKKAEACFPGSGGQASAQYSIILRDAIPSEKDNLPAHTHP
jgi:hypothetical protein